MKYEAKAAGRGKSCPARNGRNASSHDGDDEGDVRRRRDLGRNCQASAVVVAALLLAKSTRRPAVADPHHHANASSVVERYLGISARFRRGRYSPCARASGGITTFVPAQRKRAHAIGAARRRPCLRGVVKAIRNGVIAEKSASRGADINFSDGASLWATASRRETNWRAQHAVWRLWRKRNRRQQRRLAAMTPARNKKNQSSMIIGASITQLGRNVKALSLLLSIMCRMANVAGLCHGAKATARPFKARIAVTASANERNIGAYHGRCGRCMRISRCCDEEIARRDIRRLAAMLPVFGVAWAATS